MMGSSVVSRIVIMIGLFQIFTGGYVSPDVINAVLQNIIPAVFMMISDQLFLETLATDLVVRCCINLRIFNGFMFTDEDLHELIKVVGLSSLTGRDELEQDWKDGMDMSDRLSLRRSTNVVSPHRGSITSLGSQSTIRSFYRRRESVDSQLVPPLDDVPTCDEHENPPLEERRDSKVRFADESEMDEFAAKDLPVLVPEVLEGAELAVPEVAVDDPHSPLGIGCGGCRPDTNQVLPLSIFSLDTKTGHRHKKPSTKPGGAKTEKHDSRQRFRL
jgi:hypothetical protein